MKSIRIHAPGSFSLDDIETPDFGESDALVRIDACGICGSDLHYIDIGGTGFHHVHDGPSALGHEAAGEVLALGAEVGDVAVGDLVAVNPIDRKAGATIGNGGPEGALSEVLLVRNAATPGRLVKLPDGLDTEIGALAEPMGVALHAVNRSGVQPGSKAVVLGAGPIGIGATLWLKHRGAEHVVVVDLSADRLALAGRLGADAVVQAGSGDLREQLAELHGTAPRDTADTDVFIDAAGSADALGGAVRAARYGTQITVVAVYKAPPPVDLSVMLHKEMSLVTSVAYPTELPEVVAFLADNADRMRDFIGATYDLEDFEHAVAHARDSSAGKVMVRVRR